MTFHVFNDPAVRDEVRDMLEALKTADHAISDLEREVIQQFADELGVKVYIRKLKSKKMKVVLQ